MQSDGLDPKDIEIIELLKNNARLTYSEIGEKVGLSRTAIKNRVSAMEKAGIIKGYHASIESFASPTMMSFVVNLETKPEHFDEAKAYFQQAEETKTLIQTSGRCHLLAICVASDVPAMRNWIMRFIVVYQASYQSMLILSWMWQKEASSSTDIRGVCIG